MVSEDHVHGTCTFVKNTVSYESDRCGLRIHFSEKRSGRAACKGSSQDNGWFYTIEFLLRAERDGMKIYDMPVEWQEDYNTTVKVWKTIKNYLIQMYHLKKAFRQEDKLRK